ncbi:MAG: NAD-dependent epimerase [Nocardioides sp.]|nr:NAD-dependent epimerase [Nocardioides sp.]
MKLIVFGANGPTGRLLTAQALDEGHDVTAFTRHPDAFPLSPVRLRVVAGDVYDAESVAGAVRGQDAVLSTLGVPFSRKPIEVYSAGGRSIVAAMHRHDVARFVCVTSSVCATNPGRTGGLFFDKVVQPLVENTIGKMLYDDMRRLEDMVIATDLDWTIVRPSGLFETPGVTAYKLGEGHLGEQFTSRADLADCLLRQADDDTWSRRPVAVATVAVRPSIVQLIWREGIRKGAPDSASPRRFLPTSPQRVDRMAPGYRDFGRRRQPGPT